MKKSNLWGHVKSVAFTTVLGILLGRAMVRMAEWQIPADALPGEKLYRLGWMLVFFGAALFLQLVLHEGGHLIFGLLSGYRFQSFRIGSLMLLKEQDRFVLRKLKIAGTAGQCLMSPPDPVDGKLPVMAYNLGGSLVNLLTAILFLAAFVQLPRDGLAALFSMMMGTMGLFLGLTNGIPIHTPTVDNDGYNALALGRNQDAQWAFWLQMKLQEQLAQGVRLKDMPGEWFEIPSDEAMKNSMVASRGVAACNRLMDQGLYAEADRQMAHLLEIESGMAGIHRNLMICDRIFCELIGQNRREVLDGLRTSEQLRFMKAMGQFPSVLRTEYVWALLGQRDEKLAENTLAAFEKNAKTYPYPTDILSERELIRFAQKRAGEQ